MIKRIPQRDQTDCAICAVAMVMGRLYSYEHVVADSGFQCYAKGGVKPFGLHAIRHLQASILDVAGYPITIIQGILRHKSANRTARYLHSLRGMRVALDDAFKRKDRPIAPLQASGRPSLRVISRGRAPQETPQMNQTV